MRAAADASVGALDVAVPRGGSTSAGSVGKVSPTLRGRDGELTGLDGAGALLIGATLGCEGFPMVTVGLFAGRTVGELLGCGMAGTDCGMADGTDCGLTVETGCGAVGGIIVEDGCGSGPNCRLTKSASLPKLLKYMPYSLLLLLVAMTEILPISAINS